MILDGNTDWDPDDVDEVIDPGETVGIGPLPQRGPAGRGGSFDDAGDHADPRDQAESVDPDAQRPLFGPLSVPGETDRPPMVTDRLPAAAEHEAAPHGWIASGPLPAGASAVGLDAADPIPTGPVPITPVPMGVGIGASARVAAQAAVVVLAAGLVGLVVYGVLRSAGGSSGSPEQAEVDRSDDLAVEPGPGEASGGLIGSKRGTVDSRGSDGDSSADAGTGGGETSDADGDGGTGNGAGTDDADRDGDGIRDADADGGGPPSAGGPASAGGDPSPGRTPDNDPAGPTTVAGQPGSVLSTNVPPVGDPSDRSTTSTTSRSGTTDSLGRTSTTRRTTSQPSVASTIDRSTTTRRATTSAPSTSTSRQTTTTTATTSTTAATTTTVVPDPVELIRTPQLSSQTWEVGLFLRANDIAGAVTYCWTLIGRGGELTQCPNNTSYRLPPNRTIPGPGPVTIRAEARSSDGSVLASQQVEVQLLARSFISSPRGLAARRLDRTLSLAASDSPTASRYCWTLIQGSANSGQLCSSERTLEIAAGSPTLAGFEPGVVQLQATAEAGGVIVGRQEALFRFTEP